MDNVEDDTEPSAINNAGNATAVFPDDFFEESANWESPHRETDENENVSLHSEVNLNMEDDDIDEKFLV
jgi:hypothetical protein